MEGRWSVGQPHSAGPAVPQDARDQLWLGLRERLEEAVRNGPVLKAMERWLAGEPVPSFDDQIKAFGPLYANHWYAMEHDIPLEEAWGGIHDTMAVSAERSEFVRRFGFAVPCKEALVVLAAHQPLLEIGAGAGSWACLLAMRGVDIVATDAMIEEFAAGIGTYFPVQKLQGKTAVRRWPDRNVFCSWPSLNRTWLRQAARAMRPGRFLIVVREDATADERTWDYVEDAFEPHGSYELVNFHYMHDRVEVWKKLSPMRQRRRPEHEETEDE